MCEVFIESPFAVRMYTASHLFAHQLFIYSQQPDQIREWCQTVTALSRFVAAILKYTLISNTGWNALFLSSHNAQIGLTQTGKLTMSFCWYLFLDIKISYRCVTEYIRLLVCFLVFRHKQIDKHSSFIYTTLQMKGESSEILKVRITNVTM